MIPVSKKYSYTYDKEILVIKEGNEIIYCEHQPEPSLVEDVILELEEAGIIAV